MPRSPRQQHQAYRIRLGLRHRPSPFLRGERVPLDQAQAATIASLVEAVEQLQAQVRVLQYEHSPWSFGE